MDSWLVHGSCRSITSAATTVWIPRFGFSSRNTMGLSHIRFFGFYDDPKAPLGSGFGSKTVELSWTAVAQYNYQKVFGLLSGFTGFVKGIRMQNSLTKSNWIIQSKKPLLVATHALLRPLTGRNRLLETTDRVYVSQRDTGSYRDGPGRKGRNLLVSETRKNLINNSKGNSLNFICFGELKFAKY